MSELFGHDEQAQVLSLPPTKRDPSRVMIRVGVKGKGRGKVAATLSVKLLNDLGIQIGQPWTEELEQTVANAAVFDKAFRAATRRLARRAMSRQMLADKLRTLNKPPDPPLPAEVIDRVLTRLEELDLLDDEAFGQALVRDLLSRKAAGPRLLQQKLYQKGIRGSLADRLIREATDDDDAQQQSAIDFARKRAASLARFDAPTRKRRLYGQLARRGFDPDTIKTAMAAVEQDADQDEQWGT